jgi:glycosyltransferase involved in cell wall biosynthesis
MKLLIWSQYFWPEHFRINEMVRALSENGAEPTILTGKPNYPDGKILQGYRALGVGQEKFFGMDVIRMPLIPRGTNSFKGLLLNSLSFILSGYCIAPFTLRRKKIDVVFVYATSPLLQALPAIFIAKLKRVPLVIWVQDLWPESLEATGFIKNYWLLKFIELFIRYIYASADSILIQSEGFRPSVDRLVRNKGKVFFYPNPSEDFKAIYTLSKKECKVAQEIKEHFSIVFTGNIGSAQACETIIAAAQKLLNYPTIRFYLIGSGSQFTAISLDVERRKLTNVVMTGHLPPKDMASIFAASSVLLVSLRRNPALSATIPSKLQSYLSAGKPIIACLDGEAARVVMEAKAGLSCPAEDVDALADAVLSLHKMTPQKRTLLGKNAYQYFKTHFYLSKGVNELMGHLRNVLPK